MTIQKDFEKWWSEAKHHILDRKPEDIARLHYGHIQWMINTINKQEVQLRTLAEAVLEHHAYSCHWCGRDQDTCSDYANAVEGVNCCQCEACKLAREVLK